PFSRTAANLAMGCEESGAPPRRHRGIVGTAPLARALRLCISAGDKGEIMDGRLLVGAALLAGLVPTLAPGAPVDAIRAGDMQQMIPEIIAIYENAGLSWDHGIDWKVGPFTTTFWFYDPLEDDIQAG